MDIYGDYFISSPGFLCQQALVHVVVGRLVPRILGKHLVLRVDAPVGVGVHPQCPRVGAQRGFDVLLVDVVPLAHGRTG